MAAVDSTAVNLTPAATAPAASSGTVPSGTGPAPSTAELVERTRAIRPLLAANAGQGEADRRVTDESIKAMTDAGLFKIAVPKRYGGYETSVRTMLEVSAAVGEADGGTAWVLTLINVCHWLTGLFPRQAQDDVLVPTPMPWSPACWRRPPPQSRSPAAGGSPGSGTTTPGPGTPPGPGSASRSPTPTARWSTRASR